MIKKTAAYLLLILLAAGAQPAMSAFWEWSKTAGNNATADATINWSEGMSPSSVNDSARAMMARAAEYRDDISGALTTGGTSTAYTVTTNQGLDATPTDGQLIAFTVHATNGISATLQADGGNTYPLQTSPGVGLGAGTLVLGSPYTAKFSSANSSWILRDFYGNPYAIPLGGMMPYTGTASTPNSNFVFPYGQCISRTTYATYFALVSTTFGACDGVTTFAVPDLRGRVIAGQDNMGGSAANRMTAAGGCTGTSMGSACGTETYTFARSQLPNTSISVTVTDPGHSHTFITAIGGAGGGGFNVVNSGSFTTTSTNTTGITAAFNLNGAVSQTASPQVQPTMIIPYILRII